MSPKRMDSPSAPLCRRTFKDGRRCALPAHPGYDGLCYNHGTMRPRGSRHDNLQREIEPLLQAGFSPSDIHHAMHAVQSAIAAQRVDYSRAAVLSRIGKLMIDGDRQITEEQFRTGSGPRWDRIRAIMDQRAGDFADPFLEDSGLQKVK